MHYTILYCQEMAIIGVHILFSGPSKIAMVKDIVLAVFRSYSIRLQQVAIYIGMPNAETEITDNKVFLSSELRFMMGNNDSHSWRRLTGKGKVLPAVKIEPINQPDLSGYGKAHRERFSRELLDSPAERTFCLAVSIVLKRGHIDHFTASTAGSVFTKSLCAGKRHKRIGQETGKGY